MTLEGRDEETKAKRGVILPWAISKWWFQPKVKDFGGRVLSSGWCCLYLGGTTITSASTCGEHLLQPASSPTTPWQTDGEIMGTVIDFILGGSKITVDGDCSHEIKRCLLLRRKAMTNLESILKSRDITLPTKVCLVKAMVFPVVMYGCESWTIKKAEHRRTDAFELWCYRRLLRVPWSILKEISPEYSLEGLIFWPPDVKNWLTGKDSDARKDWRQEKATTEDEMVGWHHQFDGHEFEQAPGIGVGQRSLVCCSPWGHKALDTTERLN